MRARAEMRSIPQQVAYWGKVGRAALDNPDLPVEFVLETLRALEEESEPFELPDTLTIALRQKPAFKQTYKNLHANQREAVHDAMRKLIANPTLGHEKKGDLSGVWAYRFDGVNPHVRSPACGTNVHAPGLLSASARTSPAT